MDFWEKTPIPQNRRADEEGYLLVFMQKCCKHLDINWICHLVLINPENPHKKHHALYLITKSFRQTSEVYWPVLLRDRERTWRSQLQRSFCNWQIYRLCCQLQSLLLWEKSGSLSNWIINCKKKPIWTCNQKTSFIDFLVVSTAL